MRYWITFLSLLFAAAVVHADADACPLSPGYVVSAELSQGEESLFDPTDAPLFATAFSSMPFRLCGAETEPAKTRHSIPVCFACLHPGRQCRIICSPLHTQRAVDMPILGSPRAVDRYVYALRRIII